MEGIQKSDNLKTENQCPVCTSKNEVAAQNCTTCGWYFPLKETPHFALELSRAKQQFQMINTFNQVLTGMQRQAKMLEKISFRLDGMEGEMNQMKTTKSQLNTLIPNYEYPKLEPIQKVADFDTSDKLRAWWNSQEEQWQIAFNQAVLRKSDDYQPTEEEIKYIIETPTLRLVGPRGMHPNIDFELTNLSGVKHLSNLTILVVSHQKLTHLEGIEHLSQLESLFVNANKLTNLKEVHYLPQLKELYCNVNQIIDLHPLANLTQLEVINCQYNKLNSLEGITPKHAELKEFIVLPNEKIMEKERMRIEEMGIQCKKG